MKQFSILLFAVIIFPALIHAQVNADSATIKKIYSEELVNGKSYDWLRELCMNIGNRLSGSPQAEMAVQWGKKTMEDAGFDKVWLQEITVPKWVRGQKEFAEIIGVGKVDVLALGNSVATPEQGITANIIEIQSFDELDKMDSNKIKGKIIFFNHVFNETNINTFESYGEGVEYRWRGASAAADKGAIAVVVRSVTPALDDFAHTGSMHYVNENKKIPAVAISTTDAELLHASLQKNPDVQFKLITYCKFYDDVKSYNVIGEIKGSQNPEQVIVVGGHLDSWDVGQGAHDDGAGVVQSMDVLRIFKALNLKPKKTIRCVLFMNEENGTRGAKAYSAWAKINGEKAVAAIETDAGGFFPRGFSFQSTDKKINTQFAELKKLFATYGIYEFTEGYAGSDIEPLEDAGAALIGLFPDSQRYFNYHHSNNDIFENVNKRELELGAAAMAALIWWIDENM